MLRYVGVVVVVVVGVVVVVVVVEAGRGVSEGKRERIESKLRLHSSARDTYLAENAI